MSSVIIFVAKDSTEGGFEATALDYSIFTEADTFEKLKEMVKDAVVCHFEEAQRPSIICCFFTACSTIA